MNCRIDVDFLAIRADMFFFFWSYPSLIIDLFTIFPIVELLPNLEN